MTANYNDLFVESGSKIKKEKDTKRVIVRVELKKIFISYMDVCEQQPH